MSAVCPLCQADLRGEPVPEKYLRHDPECTSATTGVRCFCLPYGETTYFSRIIGHEVSGVYDGVLLFWSCPDCRKAWSRDWRGFGCRQEAADTYVAHFNAASERGAA